VNVCQGFFHLLYHSKDWGEKYFKRFILLFSKDLLNETVKEFILLLKISV